MKVLIPVKRVVDDNVKVHLGVDVQAHLQTRKISEPPQRSADIRVPDVATLVAQRKNAAKVL